MDSFNSCVQCNPDKNWLELEFMSENDEPIDGLAVTITLNDFSDTRTQTTSAGKVHFTNIPAGEWRASVTQTSLLTEVEKYDSRDKEIESPVKERVDKENADPTSTEQPPKQYKNTTIGDFWDEAPGDEFLTEYHTALDINASEEKAGFRLSHNQSYVFEVKALRSYMPAIIDTDEFNLVNSYTFALLSKLAYATDEFNKDDGKTTGKQGAIDTIISKLKSRDVPTHTADLQVKWLLKEIPYSTALSSKYYADKETGSEGYIIFNDEVVIIGVRGTEPYFESRDADTQNKKWRIIKATSGLHAIVADKVKDFAESPVMQDLFITDLDAAQVAPKEFGGTYVHRGFYQYANTLWDLMNDDIKDLHRRKKFYVCGHSLGGAGALLISALLQERYQPSFIHLYTYGMPRTGTSSFVSRYKNILHHRHVNDHDLVPQIPMTWVNTDLAEGIDGWDVFSSGVTLAKKMITDNDDDNYMHHGKLSQLLTFDEPNQILLTPRQTQVTMLDIAKLAENDSLALVDNLSEASVVDHGMEYYIPNLMRQLCALSDESLMDKYHQAISSLTQELASLQSSYIEVKNAWADELGKPYSPIVHINASRLKVEINTLEKLMENKHRIKQELSAIVKSPERLPLAKLLVAQQALSDEIKEQLQ
ncbi:lipase [Vibrio europaeus]|uniref:lipase family protein n=1 Tax=Vibrio europaeus TaxID=300876 RepID=UPI00233F2E56|nr:lipase [Vibrio europaeus]MDC5819645.1 lipase [Vibrio europaeus]